MELQKALRKVHYVTLTKRRQVHYPGFKVAQHRQMNADERTQACQSQRTVWQQQHTIGSETVHEQQRTDPYSPKTLDGKDVTPHVPAAQRKHLSPHQKIKRDHIGLISGQLS